MTPVAHELPAMAALNRCRSAWEATQPQQTLFDPYDPLRADAADVPGVCSERATGTDVHRSDGNRLISPAGRDANTPPASSGGVRPRPALTPDSEETT